jgi:hypothetical protein
VTQSLPLPEVNEVPPEVSGVNSATNSRRHFVFLAASILVHAALIALILYSAPRLSGGGHDWVLAYLVEVGPGNGGTAGGAKGPPAIKIEPASIPEAPIRSALSADAVASKFLDIDVRDEIRTLPRPGVMASLSAGARRAAHHRSIEDPHLREALVRVPGAATLLAMDSAAPAFESPMRTTAPTPRRCIRPARASAQSRAP